MLSIKINSSQESSPNNEPLNINFNDRINSLNLSFMHHLESLSNTNLSLEQIFHRIPVIFRFLNKSLQSQQKFSNEYHYLSGTVQNMISIFSQYIHDRHVHENELFALKEKITQLIGQIGYAKYSLEQYWTIIYSLEHEIERLQMLLQNPQVLQVNLQKFQALQETQKVHLDRFIKGNEKLKLSITKQKHSVELIQTQIETDLEELQRLQPILYRVKTEEKDVNNHRLQIGLPFKNNHQNNDTSFLEKQNSHLQNIIETTKNMEHECNDRMKTTQNQYDLVQKRFNDLKNNYNQNNQNLLSIQANETNIKQEIDNVKNQINAEQTRSIGYCDKIQNLQHQTHEFEFMKRRENNIIKSEEHNNIRLERKQLMLRHNRLKLDNRIHYLTEQLNHIMKKNQTNEQIITINNIRLKDQQNKITTIKIALKKLIHLNNNFEKILRENRFIRIDEQEKLRSIKQISFRKRKQLITHRKRLHILSTNEHNLINKTIRNSFEIIRLNSIFHNINSTEKYFQSMVRNKKTELMKREKERTSLSRYLRDHNDRIHFLSKKHQLIENELASKIDHYQLLDNNLLKQNCAQIIISNRKQHVIYLYEQKLQVLNGIDTKNNQLESLSDNEMHRIINKTHENEQLKLNIHNLKQQIINAISKNKRHLDEYSLLNEKIRLYTQLNDIYNQQQQQCSFHIDQFSRRILHLQQENKQLLTSLQNVRKEAIITTTYQHSKVLKNDDLYRILSYRPLITRDSSIRVHTDKALENYSTLTKRYSQIIHECVQWREKLAWINQIYSCRKDFGDRKTNNIGSNMSRPELTLVDFSTVNCRSKLG
ncbi:unnamed protein product [Rotaria magnacalcarata]|uniref:Uncharacterized protein n=4 Tax=Rotaria magnacalcarata TaxID=392030 RepID=A0A819ETJ9_9BILA|nr:unnamed protein product [Rotaria magnacalcarata]